MRPTTACSRRHKRVFIEVDFATLGESSSIGTSGAADAERWAAVVWEEEMKTLFVVTRIRGQAWDASKPMNSQEQWPEHATFMNQLAADGFVMLGGPIGDEGNILLVVDAANENEIRSTLAHDPWSQSGLLEVQAMQRWTILLQAGEGV